jgi:hypothetical protein
MEAVRNDNPTPLVEYAHKSNLTRHPEWEWVKEYSTNDLEDFRQSFIAKYENTPKYKFGVQIPCSISHALKLDKLNGNNLWQEAIQKEMDQLREYNTFRVPTTKDDLSKYQQIPYHMVFDCKFDGRRKGRLVAGGNHTVVTSEQVYSGVVGIETVRTILAQRIPRYGCLQRPTSPFSCHRICSQNPYDMEFVGTWLSHQSVGDRNVLYSFN